MSDSNYIKATDAIEDFKKMKDRRDEPMQITPASGIIEASASNRAAAQAINDSAFKMSDLELAEKALEVMGWKPTDQWLCTPPDAVARGWMHPDSVSGNEPLRCKSMWIASNYPLSNDLAAEGKRWLLDREHRLSIDLFERDGERLAYVVVFSDDNMQWVRIYDVEAPTENEAVLRAVVEIGSNL